MFLHRTNIMPPFDPMSIFKGNLTGNKIKGLSNRYASRVDIHDNLAVELQGYLPAIVELQKQIGKKRLYQDPALKPEQRAIAFCIYAFGASYPEYLDEVLSLQKAVTEAEDGQEILIIKRTEPRVPVYSNKTDPRFEIAGLSYVQGKEMVEKTLTERREQEESFTEVSWQPSLCYSKLRKPDYGIGFDTFPGPGYPMILFPTKWEVTFNQSINFNELKFFDDSMYLVGGHINGLNKPAYPGSKMMITEVIIGKQVKYAIKNHFGIPVKDAVVERYKKGKKYPQPPPGM